MIVLLEPPAPPGFTSGGYRYNREVGMRLERDGTGRRVAVSSDALVDALDDVSADVSADDVALVDSAYLGALRDAPVEALRRTAGARMLLHYRPSENPLLAADARVAWRAVEAAWCGAVAGVVATGDAIAARLAADHPAVAITVAPPGMDPRFEALRATRRPRDDDGERTVVAVGPITPAKAQRDVVVAAARLARERPVRVVLVGDRPDAAYAEAVAEAAGDARLSFAGVVPIEALIDLYATADAFVSASPFESYGMAVTEAAASGLPVVAVRAGAVERVVRAPVDPGDVDAITDRLRRALAGEPTTHPIDYPTWDDTARGVSDACTSGGDA